MEREEQGATSTNPGANENSTKSMELDPQLEAYEENEAEEEDDDDDEEEESNYKLRFERGMDPLAFTEDDAFGVQPYQQFERLENEYEALAAKKRKSLATSQSFRKTPVKKLRQDDDPSETFEEIMEAMTYGMRRKSRRKNKKRGRRKGSKNKVSAEVTRKLGDATLQYAHGRYEEAICLLKEVIRLSPNLPDPYHTLGLVYNAIGDKKRALNFYMLAAHLTPKDESLWKLLVTWSIEQGNNGQAMYCLSKAITSDPEDLSLRFHRASLYVELEEYQKAAESYEQILRLRPENAEALKTAAKLYQKCGQHERAVSILEDYLKSNPNEADLGVVHLLVSIHMESNAYVKALNNIEHAQQVYSAGKELPLYLIIKAGVCHVYLGNVGKAEAIFSVLQRKNACDHPQLITEVADALANLEHYGSALTYYAMLEGNDDDNSGLLYSKMARCYLFLGERVRSIEYYYKALNKLNDGVDARLNLASLLIEENKEDEAISLNKLNDGVDARLNLASLLIKENKEDEAICVLSRPTNPESTNDHKSDECRQWWMNVKIKLKLSQIYKARGSSDAFVDAIYPSVRESLFLETIQQKVKARKRLTKSVLFERVKVLDERQTDNVFHGFRPMASASDLSKAARAKKLLQKKEALREEKRAAALAAGTDWKSDDSDDEPPQALREPPLPNLLKDEEHHCLIIDLCKALALLRRYWEALEIINLSLKLACSALSVEKKEELRSLGAQIAYNIADPSHGWDCARYIVNQHPYSFSAWNCYYKVISRLDNRYSRHNKFLHGMRVKYKDCIPPIIIFGHQLTMISQHQAAAREYLEAYKLMPDNPLINLCVGSSLISLALGHRLQNKHQCIVQGLAFLFNNLLLSENGQEALYNIARAYHHVGLVSLATAYYEKVLSVHENDYPIPKLPNENPDLIDNRKPGYCNLHREAAYNLHLIYKKSGALDLARQVLKDHCSV